jgi:tetratricopeptide (TPR) repeat protein
MARADMAGRAGDWKQVAIALEQLVRRYPNQADYWYNLGLAHLNLDNPLRAIQVLRKAVSLSPRDRDAGLQLARALLEAGYMTSAAETLRLMVKHRTGDSRLLLYLGRIYEADSKRREALQTYRKALELTTNPSLELLLLLIRTSAQLEHRIEAGMYISDYLERGGSEEAIQEWRRLVESSGY